jgi:hypothetical protein
MVANDSDDDWLMTAMAMAWAQYLAQQTSYMTAIIASLAFGEGTAS